MTEEEMPEKPDCYKCKWRQPLQGDEHSSCGHPFTDMANSNNLNVTANRHGVQHGWFQWPFSFDPTWLMNCDGFEEK